MERVGFVREVSNGKAEVEVRRISGCGGNCKGCGGCDTPNHVVILKNTIGAKVGDYVEIKGDTKNILIYTLIVYMIPFVMLLLGLLFSINILRKFEVVNYEPLSFLIGIIFLALGYLIVKLIDRMIGHRENTTIKMTRII